MNNQNRLVQVHKYLPTASDVHTDSLLNNFSVAFLEDMATTGYASSIFPMVPVNHQTDKYRVWPKDDFFRDSARKRAPGTPVQRGGFRVSDDSYYCDVYEAGTLIPEEVMKNADNPAELDQAATNYVMQTLAIRREVDFVTNYMTSGIWGTSIVGVTSGASAGTSVLGWNVTSSTPIEDVIAARKAVRLASGRRANTIVLGYDVRAALATNAQIVARLVNGQTPGQIADVSDADLARVFGVDRVIIADAVYNSAAEGATAVMAFIAGDFVWVGYVDPNPGLQSLTAGVSFTWNGMPGGTGVGTRMVRHTDPEIYADKIDGFRNWGDKVVSAGAGYFFSNMVA